MKDRKEKRKHLLLWSEWTAVVESNYVHLCQVQAQFFSTFNF